MALLFVSASPACSDPATGERNLIKECGVPTPSPDATSALVPKKFQPNSAVLIDAEQTGSSVSFALVASLDIQETLAFYRSAAASGGYELASEDNEGFEAEMFIRRPNEFGAITIRSTQCPDVSLVHITVAQQ